MPNHSEIIDYAKKLPPIYREILAAYPAIEPARGATYGLAFQTLAMYFANNHLPYNFGEVRDACLKMAEGGFVEIKNGIFAHPTDIGEQLIAAVTEKPAATTTTTAVPQLPPRPW